MREVEDEGTSEELKKHKTRLSCHSRWHSGVPVKSKCCAHQTCPGVPRVSSLTCLPSDQRTPPLTHPFTPLPEETPTMHHHAACAKSRSGVQLDAAPNALRKGPDHASSPPSFSKSPDQAQAFSWRLPPLPCVLSWSSPRSGPARKVGFRWQSVRAQGLEGLVFRSADPSKPPSHPRAHTQLPTANCQPPTANCQPPPPPPHLDGLAVLSG